jgi:DeoR family transcriptional regulator, fructose operon transcriptional repressor
MERIRFEPEVAERLSTRKVEKPRIAEAAMSFVPARSSILLDAGTTTGKLAELLPAGRELTVVTNCLPIATVLASHPSMNVLIASGRVREDAAAVDDLAARFLNELASDVAFVAANGVTVERGLTTPDPAEAAVKRAMTRGARRVVLTLRNHDDSRSDATVKCAFSSSGHCTCCNRAATGAGHTWTGQENDDARNAQNCLYKRDIPTGQYLPGKL